MVTPILEKFSKEYDSRLKICKINVDEHTKVAAKYQILSISHFIIFQRWKSGRTACESKDSIGY